MKDKRREPNYSMGAKLEDTANKMNKGFPGPNQYEIPSKVVENSGKTFGIKLRSSLDQGPLIVPGPGAYESDK